MEISMDALNGNSDMTYAVTSYDNRRDQARVKLPLILMVRRPNNSSYYWRVLKTENVSRAGARIICNVQLEIGAELEIQGLNGQFWAQAVVRHVEEKEGGGWYLGLEFSQRTGKWVIN
jgi:hypothetical protein